MQAAFAIGATFYLQKPVDKHKLGALFRMVSAGMVENRRKYTRAPLHADVTCTVGSRTLRGVSWNLSHGGMQVEVSGLQAKDTVRLSFQLPVSAVTVDGAGIVVWANEQRQGIQFTKVSAQCQESIRQFIAEVEKMDR